MLAVKPESGLVVIEQCRFPVISVMAYGAISPSAGGKLPVVIIIMTG
jgi:hypothetical protein